VREDGRETSKSESKEEEERTGEGSGGVFMSCETRMDDFPIVWEVGEGRSPIREFDVGERCPRMSLCERKIDDGGEKEGELETQRAAPAFS